MRWRWRHSTSVAFLQEISKYRHKLFPGKTLKLSHKVFHGRRVYVLGAVDATPVAARPRRRGVAYSVVNVVRVLLQNMPEKESIVKHTCAIKSDTARSAWFQKCVVDIILWHVAWFHKDVLDIRLC
jgi:hypothetical protein